MLFLDEVDKCRQQDCGATKDVGGLAIQEEILARIEQPGPLWILAGAFVGLREIIEKRCGVRSAGVGFQRDAAEPLSEQVLPEDLVAFGMLAELVGRIRTIAELANLDDESLVQAAHKKHGAVTRVAAMLAAHGVDLSIDNEAMRHLAKKANRMGLGVRGLESLVTDVGSDLLFKILGAEARVRSARVTLECVRDGVSPQLELAEPGGGLNFELVKRWFRTMQG